MARKGVKITNETDLRSDDLRRLVYAAMDEADLQGELRVAFKNRPRARSRVDTRKQSYRTYRVAIPKALQAEDKLKELCRTLGVHLVWAAWKAKDVQRHPDWDWGDQFELRLGQREPREETNKRAQVVLARETKAREHVARLETKLAKLEADKKRTMKLLRKWQKKVRYYEKRQSKAVQEADFMARLKQKTKALNKEENA